jgi:threonylcarbamoyladenosine tRNA methylthiotransferase MtaB
MAHPDQYKSVAFHTLGCKLNYSETSTLSRLLEKEGFQTAAFDGHADVYVINTCSVTDNADKECRHLVRRVQRKSPESLVVITGCYAQLKSAEIAAIPGVDLVLGAAEKFNIVHHLKELSAAGRVPSHSTGASRDGASHDSSRARISSCEIENVTGFHASFSLNDRTRSFLKVQDGCDYNCSFCTIPMARGKSRSDTIAGVIANVRQLADGGQTKEIVLTGVNLGDFGKSAASPEDFFALMRELEKIEGIDRYRISSIEPNLLTPEMIRWVAGSKKFMPHFHIPLQSGCNKILALMRRRYKKELYAQRVRLIKELMPHCAIGVDVIVGFPGETEADFSETVDFLLDLEVSYLHVFTYSERDDTLALELGPVVPIHTRNERNRLLRNLSAQKMQVFTRLHEGQTRPVLFEGHVKHSTMDGYTDNYIKVTTPYRPEWVNQVVDWRL